MSRNLDTQFRQGSNISSSGRLMKRMLQRVFAQLEARMKVTNQQFGVWKQTLADGTEMWLTVNFNGPVPVRRSFVVARPDEEQGFVFSNNVLIFPGSVAFTEGWLNNPLDGVSTTLPFGGKKVYIFESELVAKFENYYPVGYTKLPSIAEVEDWIGSEGYEGDLIVNYQYYINSQLATYRRTWRNTDFTKTLTWDKHYVYYRGGIVGGPFAGQYSRILAACYDAGNNLLIAVERRDFNDGLSGGGFNDNAPIYINIYVNGVWKYYVNLAIPNRLYKYITGTVTPSPTIHGPQPEKIIYAGFSQDGTKLTWSTATAQRQITGSIINGFRGGNLLSIFELELPPIPEILTLLTPVVVWDHIWSNLFTDDKITWTTATNKNSVSVDNYTNTNNSLVLGATFSLFLYGTGIYHDNTLRLFFWKTKGVVGINSTWEVDGIGSIIAYNTSINTTANLCLVELATDVEEELFSTQLVDLSSTESWEEEGSSAKSSNYSLTNIPILFRAQNATNNGINFDFGDLLPILSLDIIPELTVNRLPLVVTGKSQSIGTESGVTHAVSINEPTLIFYSFAGTELNRATFSTPDGLFRDWETQLTNVFGPGWLTLSSANGIYPEHFRPWALNSASPEHKVTYYIMNLVMDRLCNSTYNAEANLTRVGFQIKELSIESADTIDFSVFGFSLTNSPLFTRPVVDNPFSFAWGSSFGDIMAVSNVTPLYEYPRLNALSLWYEEG